MTAPPLPTPAMPVLLSKTEILDIVITLRS